MFEIVQAITVHEDRSYEYTVWAHAVADFSYGHSIGPFHVWAGSVRCYEATPRSGRSVR